MTAYTLKDYWEERLRKNFNLTGVGHQGLSAYYNACLYKRRLEALESGCQRLGFHVSELKFLKLAAEQVSILNTFLTIMLESILD